jgi:hypothetical protein
MELKLADRLMTETPHEPRNLAEVLALLFYIWDAPVSKFGQDIDYQVSGFS